jgi:hypothetical protein
MLEGEIRMMSPIVNHVWDSRKGWMKPKKRIEVLPYLYLEGHKLFWEIEEYPLQSFTEKEKQQQKKYDKKIIKDIFYDGPCPLDDELREFIQYIKLRRKIKKCNMVLKILPIIPIAGFILGLVI